MNAILEKFLREATEDDYAKGADHHPRGVTARGVAGRVFVAVAAALLGIIVVSAAVTFRSSAESRTSTHDALSDRAGQLSGEVGELQAQVTEQQGVVDAFRAGLVATDDVALAAELEALAADSGVVELLGPGITVTINDAPDAEAGSLNRVLDRDLQDITNVLWRMGAQGISINGERLTQTSAIRGAGQAILVNYRPLNRPYVVSAVGTRSTGTQASQLEVLLELLGRDYGLVSSVEVGDVALPAGTTHDSRFAGTSTRSDGEQGGTSR